jgi:hypothetical protein
MQTGNVIFLGLGVAGESGAPVVAPLVACSAAPRSWRRSPTSTPTGIASESELTLRATAIGAILAYTGAAASSRSISSR